MSERKLKCGIEIHQQLDTKKLFCDCDSELKDSGCGAYYRKLRPTTSESGEIDRAALAQFQKDVGFRYQCCEGSSCLVDLDEEPPHAINEECMETALIISAMLGAQIVDEIHFMRKIIVDGSNTTGFQRTALIATDGAVEVNGKKIGILSVSLEEDAARKIEEKSGETTYRLDRAGMPLVEIATAPDMDTPEEVMEVALRIGTLLRATKKVKRGIGTIREDLNISIPEGARIEIKGTQDLKLLPEYIRIEMERQSLLIQIKDILNKRGTAPVDPMFIDVTELFADCQSKVIRGAIEDKGKVMAAALPGFAGVMNSEDGKLRLGSEMAQYARTRGAKGIFHSDELPNYGIEKEYVDALREHLGLHDPFDAFVICATKEKKAIEALTAAIKRANAALEGVPEETRDPLPDGTTRYSRPLPGAARMYPETDVPPMSITDERAARIRENMPEFPEQVEKRLVETYCINEQQARQIVRQGRDELFIKIVKNFETASVVASTLTNTYAELEREGADPKSIDDAELFVMFDMLKNNSFSKEAIPSLLREMAGGLSVEKAIAALGLKTVDINEAADLIASIVKEREEFVKEKGMEAIGPLMGPVMSALRGKIDGKEANELLEREIRKILG